MKLIRLSIIIVIIVILMQSSSLCQITGSGTTNYITKFTGTSTVGNSSIFDNGNIGIGTNSPISGYKLHISGNLGLGITSGLGGDLTPLVVPMIS